MSGDQLHASVESIRTYWDRWAAQRGFERNGSPLKVYSLRTSGETLIANVSSGRWVADCPACGGGVALWPENTQACCLTCGTIYDRIDWPDDDEIALAEATLSVREEQFQGWRRDHGETISDLRHENIVHGVPVPSTAF